MPVLVMPVLVDVVVVGKDFVKNDSILEEVDDLDFCKKLTALLGS